MIWHLEITPKNSNQTTLNRHKQTEAEELSLPGPWEIHETRGLVIEGDIDEAELARAALEVLLDPVVESAVIKPVGSADEAGLATAGNTHLIHVLPKPGVTDPPGDTALNVLQALGHKVKRVRTMRTYRIKGPLAFLPDLTRRLLVNEAVEMAVPDQLSISHLQPSGQYRFKLIEVPIRGMADADLVKTSREGQLSLSLAEMQIIQKHFDGQGRNPTDAELETIAQTWSEHCSHKTLKGSVERRGRSYRNLLKETIFAATSKLDADWVVSVFADNAGVVTFDDEFDVCFKVETHNHPSAIDPYGGANTGIGGVIRDPMGTGLGAKPIANTDIFCVAPPGFPADCLPPGVLHPKRVLKGVVAGVRDYGNRMGIPTVNGAVAFHPDYLANPLVFCGTIGLIPRGLSQKSVANGDYIVAVGGRTGRDGIHGATFSSIELTSESEVVSSGAVQIGNAITEKMVLDVLMQARDRGLYRAITDCGAGGFSSAVGEMGADLGAEVDLENAPLKYDGLSYTEIWISEAQERMVLAVPPDQWTELRQLAESEGVEATVLGRFVNTGRLTLKYHGHVVGDISMEFLHDGRPRVSRHAESTPVKTVEPDFSPSPNHQEELLELLANENIASKEWIIRQYDHEVQAGTVVKPLVGVNADAPSDAAVLWPSTATNRGLAVANGLQIHAGVVDSYRMAALAIDEAVRNCVAVGANPARIALLDNFCWGNPERAENLDRLVEAAEACHDLSLAWETPFISGKDSLYNEFLHDGQSRSIPPTLLISALGQLDDVHQAVTMDFKQAGNEVWLLGFTQAAMGGSTWASQYLNNPAEIPTVDDELAMTIFRRLHEAIRAGLVRSCHDISEGGLAVALAEMCIGGRMGLSATLRDVPCSEKSAVDTVLLFGESPSRFVVEVEPSAAGPLGDLWADLPVGRLGTLAGPGEPGAEKLVIKGLDHSVLIDVSVDVLENTWKRPLDWAPEC
ncbi:MAG: phosphoribosylformylglycinamidine synthase subunit PurL [Planctomycetota bacterium]